MTDDAPEAYDDEPSFSLNDFRNWMSKYSYEPSRGSKQHELVGLHVESKIGLKRLIAKMKSDDGDVQELAEDFKQYGGVILEVSPDRELLIEVDSGTFLLPKFFVKRAED